MLIFGVFPTKKNPFWNLKNPHQSGDQQEGTPKELLSYLSWCIIILDNGVVHFMDIL